ncbi:unnamed protein product [Pleuronectes platessa]|uniref:Uncharacterized protein n=1 Tax=Pleuronectes platessa TaxID=8262 RepID=A0A9N7TI32_PLEPL|nr:unnamed protein product [Pleuronectes platessa]
MGAHTQFRARAGCCTKGEVELPVWPLSLGPEVQVAVQSSHESDFCTLKYDAEKTSGGQTAAGDARAELSLHGFVPVTPEAEAPRCAKAASRCFSLRCDRHKVLTWEWMGASCYLRLGAALKRPV